MPGYALASLAPLTEVPTGPDSNRSTIDTVRAMQQYIEAGVDHPSVQQATRRALAGCPADAPVWLKAQRIYRYVTQTISFRADEDVLMQMGYSPDKELLIPPYLLLDWGAGDCDDFTMLTCSMLRAAGVDARIVTIAADPSAPDRWSHVYSMAILDDGRGMVLDTAAAVQRPGLYPGWEAPNAFRRQEWYA